MGTIPISPPASDLLFVLQRKPPRDAPVDFPLDIVANLPESELVLLTGDNWIPSTLFDDAYFLNADYKVETPVGQTNVLFKAGRYRIRAVTKRRANVALASEVFEFDTATAGTERTRILMKPAETVTVRVVDESGSPIAGVGVCVDGVLSDVRKTDARGLVTTSLLPKGRAAISLAGGKWRLRGSGEITVGGVIQEVQGELAPPQVEVSVTGTNIGDVSFKLSPIQVYGVIDGHIDPQGRAEFRGVGPGTWHIQAWYPNERVPRHGMRLDLLGWDATYRLKYTGDGFEIVK